MSRRKTPRAAIYVRYSTRDQDPRAQLRAVRELVKRRGWTLVETYQERKHYSGRDDRRPELVRMLADARRRRFDVLAFYSLSRLARSLRLSLFVFDELASADVDVVSATEAIDLTTASGRMMRDLLAVFAAFERELIVERTVNGLAAARARGAAIGRPRRKFDRELAIQLRAEGKTQDEIASQLKIPRSTLRGALDAATAAAGRSAIGATPKKRRRPVPDTGRRQPPRKATDKSAIASGRPERKRGSVPAPAVPRGQPGRSRDALDVRRVRGGDVHRRGAARSGRPPTAA